MIIVKVGGSLFDMPDLGARLSAWCRSQPDDELLLIPGGGDLADVIRGYVATHGLNEITAHWMAIHTMGINATLLASLIPDARITIFYRDEPPHRIRVLDVNALCASWDNDHLALEHSWAVTSDAIAARVAEDTKAEKLVMMKSVDLPHGINWDQACKLGLVDAAFGGIIERANLRVEWINFREWSEGV